MTKKTKKKDKDLTGTTITFTELQATYLKVHVTKRQNAEDMLEVAGEIITKARKLLWENIFDFCPELKNYHCNYNSETGEVNIVGKRRKKK